ncbi:MAG: hypothetical protein K5896_09405 [Prevotella sp.]|nr:hypothetical protein [Prevotella sp.]
MKKQYQTPAIEIILLQQDEQILAGSQVDNINGNSGLTPGGGGSTPGRSRDYDWDEGYE